MPVRDREEARRLCTHRLLDGSSKRWPQQNTATELTCTPEVATHNRRPVSQMKGNAILGTLILTQCLVDGSRKHESHQVIHQLGVLNHSRFSRPIRCADHPDGDDFPADVQLTSARARVRVGIGFVEGKTTVQSRGQSERGRISRHRIDRVPDAKKAASPSCA